ncbi:MAG: hypothetical protein KME60_22235 [Cyanomargarita calcarea GSE-NOS-MK-12-04C]|jgi:hypothetical protein|uniref:Uncharacterized protein n=1 Tax=Cyanomargarita calcarea GSE-NOS-MK-12-04C TaxID=2839659 RepID=A0A951QQF2_9CYAN|nr:hypothetical protein [Cyanomargarita calcarea GSE-NOS-MK-12-04C]
MTERLFITKTYNNYADTFLMLGLAQLAEYALKATKQKSEIYLIDKGTAYSLEFKKPVNLTPITKLTYSSPFPPVKGQKTDTSKIPAEIQFFDTEEETKTRRVYRDFIFQQRGKIENAEETPKPPDSRTQNGVILTSMRHDRNHNDLWLGSRELKDNYGALIAALFQGFDEDIVNQGKLVTELVAELFHKATGCKLPDVASAVKVYLPTCVQGVNRVKADSNKVDSQKADWLSLWLIATGFFHFGIAERVKIADRVFDWRVLALQPQNINLSKYRDVIKRLLVHNPPGGSHGIARFDAELVLRFCQELLNHNQALANSDTEATEEQEEDFEIWDKPVNHFVSNFAGTHFGSKGQVYGVKEIFSLGLPSWIHPRDRTELHDYQNILDEHLKVVRSLSIDEGNSELLAAYRDFITGNDLYQFFRFQVSYADYVTKKLAEVNSRVVLFSKQGIDLMSRNFNNKLRQNDQDWKLTEITEDPGFLNIAKAINSATVYAGTIRDKEGKTKETGWERIYGLAQRLTSQSGSKKDFIIEISSFLASYENENLRIDEDLRKQKKPRRIWTSKDDLDRLINLIDKYGSSLVANLLIAYGYAKGWGKGKEINEADKEPESSKSGESENIDNEIEAA